MSRPENVNPEKIKREVSELADPLNAQSFRSEVLAELHDATNGVRHSQTVKEKIKSKLQIQNEELIQQINLALDIEALKTIRIAAKKTERIIKNTTNEFQVIKSFIFNLNSLMDKFGIKTETTRVYTVLLAFYILSNFNDEILNNLMQKNILSMQEDIPILILINPAQATDLKIQEILELIRPNLNLGDPRDLMIDVTNRSQKPYEESIKALNSFISEYTEGGRKRTAYQTRMIRAWAERTLLWCALSGTGKGRFFSMGVQLMNGLQNILSRSEDKIQIPTPREFNQLSPSEQMELYTRLRERLTNIGGVATILGAGAFAALTASLTPLFVGSIIFGALQTELAMYRHAKKDFRYARLYGEEGGNIFNLVAYRFQKNILPIATALGINAGIAALFPGLLPLSVAGTAFVGGGWQMFFLSLTDKDSSIRKAISWFLAQVDKAKSFFNLPYLFRMFTPSTI